MEIEGKTEAGKKNPPKNPPQQRKKWQSWGATPEQKKAWWDRKKQAQTDEPSDWKSIGSPLKRLFQNFDPQNVVKVSMLTFDWIDTSEPKTCNECFGEWQVDREYRGYTRYDTCPVCDGFTKEDPLDYLFVDVWGEYISWRRLFNVVNVIGKRDMFIQSNDSTKLVYWVCWDYQCVIKPANIDGGEHGIKILKAK